MRIMKWTVLLILAIGLAAGLAQAGDSYKIYGKMHLSTEMHNNGEDSQLALSSNGSRFGLKGSIEMNGPTSLIWQFEQKVNLAQKGNETLATRNSFIGMKGTWGTALFGIHDTPLKTMGSKVTFFRDEIGDYRQTTFSWDRRLQDVFMYITPAHESLEARFMYQFDQSPLGGEESRSVISSSANYKKNGLYLGAAFEMLTKGNASDTWADGLTTKTVFGNAASGFRAGVKYQMEKIGFAALFQTLTDYNQSDFAVDEDDGTIAVNNDKKAMTFGGEAEYKVSEGYAAKVGYYVADPDTDADDDEYSLLALGIDRDFSKSLWIYLQYAMVMNGDASAAALGCKCNGHGAIVNAAGAGENPSGISFGFARTF